MRHTPDQDGPRRVRTLFFRDQFAHCPWVHVSQDGEQCENGNHVFCLPYGLLAAVLLLAALVALPHPLLCLPHLGLAARKCRLARAVALCRKHSCEPTCRRRKHETKDTKAAFGVIVWTLDYRLSTPQTSEIVNSISSFDCSDRCKAYGLTDAHESLQLFCNPLSQINCGV